MLTVKQATQFLGISQSKLYQLISARQVAHYRIGGKILFEEADPNAFKGQCRVGILASPSPAPVIRLKHIVIGSGSGGQAGAGNRRVTTPDVRRH